MRIINKQTIYRFQNIDIYIFLNNTDLYYLVTYFLPFVAILKQ